MLFNHHSLLLPVCQKVVYGRFHGTGWLKINFDGSKSKSRQGIGFFFCDETGRPIIAGRKALLYNTTHNLLELQAIIWGLKVINSSYKGKLMIEVIQKSVFFHHVLLNGTTNIYIMKSNQQKLLKTLNSVGIWVDHPHVWPMWDYLFDPNPNKLLTLCESNQCTDYLATSAHRQEIWWSRNFPSTAMHLCL